MARENSTEEVMKSRIPSAQAVKPGKWCEDFAKAKSYAEKNKMPFMAVWSNGEQCSHCKKFNKCILDATFTKWQTTSGIVFWIGFGEDAVKANRHGGEGYKFAKNGKLTTFPFVRLYWPAGKLDVAKSGDEWDGAASGAKGADAIINKVQSYIGDACANCGDAPGASAVPSKPTTVPKYKLGYAKSKFSPKLFALTVDGKEATKLTEAVAKAIVQRYNGCAD